MPKGVYKRTDKHLDKMRHINLGKKFGPRSDETKIKLSIANSGKKRSDETIEKMRLAQLGKKASVVTRRRMRESSNQGKMDNSHSWKGDAALESSKYYRVHKWVYDNLGKPTECERRKKDNLKSHSIHWANISHEYKYELSDWARLCSSCHKLYDLGKVELNGST